MYTPSAGVVRGAAGPNMLHLRNAAHMQLSRSTNVSWPLAAGAHKLTGGGRRGPIGADGTNCITTQVVYGIS